MKRIKNNCFPYKMNLSSVFQKCINNHENKTINYFQPILSLNTNKKINNPFYENFQTNIDDSNHLTSTRNTIYSKKVEFTNEKLYNFPSNYFINTIISNKLYKNNNILDEKLTPYTNFNFRDKKKTKEIFKINKKLFIENLKFKNILQKIMNILIY